MKFHPGARGPLGVWACVGGPVLAALVAVSCASVSRTVLAPPPAIEGAVFLGNARCLLCHTNYARFFPASAHAGLYAENARLREAVGCEACHGPGSKHALARGGRGRFILNPGQDPAACYACHVGTRLEFHLPRHHPVPEGRMNCVQCHDPHGSDLRQPARAASVASEHPTCAQCHREQVRPMMYRHEALRDGCTGCHAPHGSINPKLLGERDANLCLKCHAQVPGPLGQIYIGNKPHRERLAQSGSCVGVGCHSSQPAGPPCGCGGAVGTCWSAGCHTAVHGSNINPYLLY